MYAYSRYSFLSAKYRYSCTLKITVGKLIETLNGNCSYRDHDASQFSKDDLMQMDIAWNLRNDSLEAQSPETIAFLAELLGNK